MNAASPNHSQEADATIEFAESTILQVLLTVVGLAALAVIAVTIPWKPDVLLPWAIALTLGLAAMLAGGIIGLLFAVPRRGNETVIQGSGYVANDNLVKVSDWLTGALTGIALATGKDVAKALWRFSEAVMPQQPGFVLACLVAGFCAGFLLSYLRLRASLEFIFAVGSRRANDASETIKDQALEGVAAGKLSENHDSMREIVKAVTSATGKASSRERVLAIRNRFHSEWSTDPQQGNFGGEAASRGYELLVTKWKVGPNAQLVVDLEVRASSSALRPALAEFHLHPSLPQSVIAKPANHDGRVQISIEIYEAFVIGAIVKPGEVRLELDLSQVQDIPSEYRVALQSSARDSVNSDPD